MEKFLSLLSFVFGAVVGSFLNVCIYRLPEGISIVNPPSFCPNCKYHIRWYDNIPLISYILLRGKCRNCGERISPRYFIVELVTALLFLAAYKSVGLSAVLPVYFALIGALIVVAFIDLKHRIIPDVITYSGIIGGVVLSFLLPMLHKNPFPWNLVVEPKLAALLDSLSGLFLGGGALYLIGILGEATFKREAMGGGDVKLLAMLGAFLGWKAVLLIIVISALLGAIVGVVEKIRTGASYIPYGPYLALGGLIAMFWGERIINAYLSFIRPPQF